MPDGLPFCLKLAIILGILVQAIQYNYLLISCSLPIQVLLMAVIENNWNGIVWDFKRKQLTAYAPGHCRSTNKEPWAAHTKAMDVLHTAIQSCISNYFDGWSLRWDNWTKVLLQCNRPKGLNPGKTWFVCMLLFTNFSQGFRIFDLNIHKQFLG